MTQNTSVTSQLEREVREYMNRKPSMAFDEYQHEANDTMVYPDSASLYYPALGLAGEAGEVANKIKKIIRGDTPPIDWREQIAAELGDVLWYIAALCHDLDIPLSTVASGNLDKLRSRKSRGTLAGSGDDR